MVDSEGDDVGTEILLRDLAQGGLGVGLSPADRAILHYVRKLTHAPTKMSAADVELLRGAGFEDRAVHDICCIGAYFNFVNRIADGLGVELESRFTVEGG